MCGIVGYARAGSPPPPVEGAEVLRRMTAALTHRGPDAEGYLTEGSVALGHRRLVVIDREGGGQPMRDASGTLSIVYNGEIYNYGELNSRLEGLGHPARTRSDTETILNAYAAWGERCVEHLNGMFAFVLYDAPRRRLFGARDRMGEKPLYFVHEGSFFAFASEAKALLPHPAVRRSLDVRSAALYLLFEHVPAPHAIYEGMAKLPAAATFTFDLDTGGLTTRTYWDPISAVGGAAAAPAERTSRELGPSIREGLREAVQRRLVADVPLGVFLSGGIDSSAVTASMVDLLGHERVKTFSIGFTDPRFDESAAARAFATSLGTDHREEILDVEAARAAIPSVCGILDEPFADASILPTYLLARFTRRHVTVALSGDGGDELFAGYPTFRALGLARIYAAAVPGWVDRALVKPAARRLRPDFGYFSFDFKANQFLRGATAADDERLWRWLGSFVPEELVGLLTPETLAVLDLPSLYDEVRAQYGRARELDPVNRDAYVYTKGYLAEGILTKLDRATMAVSLEARAPLLDFNLVAQAFSIPGSLKVRRGRLKQVLKEALRGVVPDEVLGRPKRGFALPIGRWFREGMRGELLAALDPRRLRDQGLFRPKAVGALVDEHLAGKRDHRKPLFTLFMFQRWRERWLD
jgi:asparagine synthase (glutamine-hydrolysing)